jgi:hypothetical protein
MKKRALLIATTALAAAFTSPAQASEKELQAEIAALKAQLAAQAAQLARLEAATQSLSQTQAVTTAKIEALPAAVPASAAPAPIETASASEPSTTITGYGEISYNGYLNDKSRNLADLKRFVFGINHRFSDKLSLVSEVEIEHAIASAGDEGEVAVEQAYLNYAFNPAVNLRAGLFLIPFGFINRSHEPPAFYGVERNEVETRIIPSTWREGGFSLYGATNFGLSYDVGVTTGFNIAKLEDASAPLASTHQELTLAKAANISVYGSLGYNIVPGVSVGAAIFTGNTTHANAAFRRDATQPDLNGLSARLTLWEAHARVQRSGFDLEALYTRGTFAQSDRIDAVLAAFNAANGTDRTLVPSAFYGWLVQGAYTFDLGHDFALSPFVRYEKYDTQARLPAGFTADPANRDRVLTTGFSFRPLPEVVFKADYQKFFNNKANDRINLGIGYAF